MRRALVLGLVAGGFLTGCDRSSSPGNGGVATAAVSVLTTPVAPPQELVAEATLLAPGRSYNELHAALGTEASFLPRSLGGLAVSVFGLPLRAAQDVDEHAPVFAALGMGQAPLAAVALPVKSGAQLVMALTSGPDGAFRAEPDEASLVRVLEPTLTARAAMLPGVRLGVLGNYLIAGNDREALHKLGPYLVRTMPLRQAGKPSVAHEPTQGDVLIEASARALGGPVKEWLTRAAGELTRGLAPSLAPFVDLDAVRSAFFDGLEAFTSADLAVTLGPSRLRLDVLAKPAQDRWRELSLVDGGSLVELPDDTVVGLAWSETKPGRLPEAKARAEALLVRLAPKGAGLDRELLERALSTIALARGDRTSAGLRCTGAGLTGFAFGEVSDRAQLAQGLADLASLHQQPAVASALKSARLNLTIRRGRLEVVPGEVTLVRIARAGTSSETEPVDLRYAIGPERFLAAAGIDTIETLQAIHRPDPARTIATRSAMRAAIEGFGERAWLAAVIDLPGIHACRAGKPGGTLAAPITLAIGPADDAILVRLEVARPLLPVAMRMLQR